MEIHHSKHHQAYINNLDKAVDGTEYADKPAEDLIRDIDALPEKIRGAVRNNGGGHANHSLFWTVMSPKGGGQPTGDVAKRIDRDLGGFDKFKEAFTPAALTRFGSGWARSEEHTSELQSLMRISYAVFCLKKKKQHKTTQSCDLV